MGRGIAWLAALTISATAFWLSAEQGINAGPSEYDDEWFLRTAESVYWFEPGYSRLSFLKEAPYPLFVAATYRLGLPLRLAHEALYLLAAGFLSWALVYRQTRAWVGLAVYAVLAFLPAHFYVLERATHDTLYSALLMLVGGALLVQYKRRQEPGRWLRWLGTGLVLGLLWNTRQERSLVVVFMVPFLAASLVAEWRRAQRASKAMLTWMVEWGPPFAIVGLMTIAFMCANYRRWGVFAVSSISAPKLQAAYRALLSIKPDRPVSYAPITHDMREKAYAVSPSFRELRPSLEGHLLHWHDAWNTYQDIPEKEYSGGFFLLLFRQAVKEAGYYHTAPETEAFYGRMADELNAAAANGRLTTRSLPPGIGWAVHPDFETYAHRLWPSWRSLWYHCWSEKGPTEPFADADVATPEIKALFDRVACRRVTHYTGATRQSQARDWLWKIYNRFAEVAFATSVLLSSVVVVVRRSPGWGLYLLPALAFAGYGLARMVAFTLIDASTLCGSEMRYYFPQVLALTIAGTWQFFEGVNRATDVFQHRRQHVSTDVDTISTRGPWRLIVCIGLLSFSVLLFAQWVYGRVHPPDFIPIAGELENANDTAISGWARLKETPDVPVRVELYSDDTLIATGLADQFRQDLFDRHIGTGNHHFIIPTPAELKDGKPHNVRVKIAETNYTLAAPITITLSP